MLETKEPERGAKENFSQPLLGSYLCERELFANLAPLIEAARAGQYRNEGERRTLLSDALLELITRSPAGSFLLAAVIDFIEQVNLSALLEEPYTFSDFELYLNQHSNLDPEENLKVRAKIVGKHLPRDDYQCLFPIGMGRLFPGPHFVTAHHPPDIDTTVASFWGWVDAFGARVSEGPHIWNLPGGEAPPQIARLFSQMFGSALFTYLPRKGSSLTLSAFDLLSSKHHELKGGEALTSQIDHGRHDKLIILVDERGHYEGCWRTSDVEGFRSATLQIYSVCHWFQTTLHRQLIDLFARPRLIRSEMEALASSLLSQSLREIVPMARTGGDHERTLSLALTQLFGVVRGVDASFGDLFHALEERGMGGFAHFRALLSRISEGPLFDENGDLVDRRGVVFSNMGEIFSAAEAMLKELHLELDRLSFAIRLKQKVLRHPPQYVTPRAELEEIRKAIGTHQHLVVAIPSKEGALLPLGTIHTSDLQRRFLGTVTLRDFCNREEVKIPSYIEIISVVDHHRAQLQTSSFPTALIGDVQSCNVLLAEQAFLVNDRYSLGGLSSDDLQGEVPQESLQLSMRHLQRRIADAGRGEYSVHPKREFTEYLSFLFAIIDDTDLLSKVTSRDVLCCASLINRLKSLATGREVISVDLEGLKRDATFAACAARKILENDDMHSLYSKVYALREQEVEAELNLCIQGRPSQIFADTKEQKERARVGQTKLFPNNFSWYLEHAPTFRKAWLAKAIEVYKNHEKLDLHIQMITTVAGADEVYRGCSGEYSHSDELWLFAAPTDEAYDRLGGFLSAFRAAPELLMGSISVEILGDKSGKLAEVLTHHFRGALSAKGSEEAQAPLAIIRFPAATITSRKGCITPYIPSLTE